MINFYFNCTFNVNAKTKTPWRRLGWTQTYIEFCSKLGWNFFTRVRYWDTDYKTLLPAVTTWRMRVVEYYGETMEESWDFMERKQKSYPKFDDKPRRVMSPDVVMYQSVYRFPFLTITNSYTTPHGIKRDKELHDEIDADIKKHEKENQDIGKIGESNDLYETK